MSCVSRCNICGRVRTGADGACRYCVRHLPCAYCGAETSRYRLDVDGAAYCSMTCNIKRQQFGSLLNERVREGDKAQGAFWFEEER